jgi:ketosteroid isomerase-like protein
MSQENVEIVREANAALNRGDVDAALGAYAPGAELRDLQSAPDQQFSVNGVEAIRKVWVAWTVAFRDFSADVDEYIDAGDVVITSVRWRGEGKESGLAIDNRQYDAFEFRDGTIIKAVLGYRSRAEALEAAGLSE